MKNNKKRIAVIIGVIIIVILAVVVIVINNNDNNENSSQETDNKKVEEKDEDDIETDILVDKLSKEHALMCTAYFNFNDEVTGLNSVFMSVNVFYDDNYDDEFYADISYYYNYKTYNQALADYQNKIAEFEDWEYNVEEDLTDGTGEISIQKDNILANGAMTVSEYMESLRETELECEQIK